MTFSPVQGPVGTTVTIDGNNFSSTASQNTVQFNGVTASSVTIDPSYPNRLTVVVPSGATSGSVNVTTPAGSATSTVNFTVAASPAPTISNLSPTIGTAGTVLTLSGSNFQSDKFKEKAILNNSPLIITSTSTSTIATSVPTKTMGGKVRVTTAYGETVSAQDVFIPPSPLLATDIQYMDRLVVGVSKTASITTGGKKGLLLFDATQNQRFYLNVTGATFSACITLTIYTPDGSLLTTTPCSSSPGDIDTTALPSAGTYTILINPNSNATGNVTLKLYDVPPDTTGIMSIDGPDATLASPSVGQNGSLTFSGTAGQRIYLSATNSTYPRSEGLNLYKPDASGNANTNSGNIIYSNPWSTGSYTDTLTLPATGTYTIYLNPNGADTGSMTFHLVNVPADATGTISVGGADATLTTTVGQNGSLTFSGTAGQRIYLSAPNSTYPRSEGINLYKPDASGNANTNSANIIYSSPWSTGSYTDTLTLPATGTYTIYLNPNGADTGSMTFHLISVPADAAGTISIDGADATLTTTVGQNGSLTFSGTAGQRIYLSAPNSTYPRSEGVNLYKPDASGNANINSANIIYSSPWATGSYTDTLTLPATGTYTIYLNPNGVDTGSITFHLIGVPADATGTISIDGADATLTTTAIGQNGSLTFSGTSGQRIYLSAPNSTYPRSEGVNLYKPDASGNANTNSGNIIYSNPWSAGSYTNTLTLPATGTYTIYLNPNGADTGSMTFHLTSVPADVTGTVTINGSAFTVTTTAEGQNAGVTFSGTSSQVATVHLTTNSIGNVTVTLKRPDNTALTSTTSSSASFNLSSQTLSTTGTYTIYVDPTAANVGSINVSVTNP